ncbi:MAG: EAL domain-containing protein [Gammaproteobacteria bacterium]
MKKRSNQWIIERRAVRNRNCCSMLSRLRFFLFRLGLLFAALLVSASFSSAPLLAAVLPDGVTLLSKRIDVGGDGSLRDFPQYVEVLPDAMELEEVIDSTAWRTPERVHTWFQPRQIYWFRFGIGNASARARKVLLEVNAQASLVNFFIFDHRTQGYTSVVISADQPFSKRLVDHRGMVLPIELQAHEERDVYVRVRGRLTPHEALTLWRESNFLFVNQLNSIELGLIAGALLVLGLVGVAMHYLARERQFLFFGLYAAAALLYLISDTGYGFQYVWPNHVMWNQLSVALSSCLLLALASVLARYHVGPNASQLSIVLSAAGVVLGAVLGFAALLLPEGSALGLGRLALALLCLMAVSIVVSHSMAEGRAGLRAFKAPQEWMFVMSFIVLGVLLLSVLGLSENSRVMKFFVHVVWPIQLMMIITAWSLRLRAQMAVRVDKYIKSLEERYEKKRMEQELLSQTMYDVLTGCPNRVALLRCLEQNIKAAPHRTVSVVLIYLDRFKEINNTLGHHNGDELLKRVARRLNGLATQMPGVMNLELREGKYASLAAIDGVVFGMLLQDLGKECLANASEQVLRSLSYPFEFKRMTLDISPHLGIATFPSHGKGATELLQHAYVAVALAQERDESVVYYTQKLDPYSARRLTLVAELKHALHIDELELFYQPQVDVKQNVVIGVEALLRWVHPKHGFISPDEFIPVAEKTGVIKQLTSWVLEAAMCEAAKWYSRGVLLRVSVNLSAKNLHSPELPKQIFTLLKKFELPPEAIALEITETAMMLDPARAFRTISELHDYGIRLSIDDFGTGYSSLAYLKQLPVSEIKIDRSFVGGMCRDTGDQVIVNTTLSMSHNLGLEVVAEGVEDERTLIALKRLGCDIAQGYYISKPIPSPELELWLRRCRYHLITGDMPPDLAAG